ncbi:MAG: hypothetical protein HKN85_03115 [Gammaproteobacteria bacterium]|nr:hypothetical protein [Gammaproteobacteria bacterium]
MDQTEIDALTSAAQQATSQGAFETTIVTAEMPNAEALNHKLKSIVLAHQEKNQGVSRSNVNGWQSAPDMLSARWGGEAAISVVQLALATCNRFSMDLKMTDTPRFEWTADMWANVSGTGASNNWHVHPQAFWSAVYYVDDGYDGPDDSKAGGELVFQDPRFPMNRMFSSELVFRSPDGRPQGHTATIRPRNGMLIAFPSWLFHRVLTYQGVGPRISLAINMTVMPARSPQDTNTGKRPEWR